MAQADSNRETELKLAVRPDDLAKLRSSPAISARAKGRAVTRTLESTYFDTVDMALMRRMVTLRVRKQGERFVQTLKGAADGASGLSRAEWEWPLAGPAPDLAVIVEPEAQDLLGAVDAADLRPVFASHVKRTTRLINGGESAIEVAFDTGEIRIGDGTAAPISEIELELKAGTPGALFDLALDIAKLAPVRVESRTKAARGYMLAAGEADRPFKAEKMALDPSVTVEGALCRIVRACLAHAVANEGAVLSGKDPEGVHQMRVALRRLRSAFALFRPFVPPEQHAWMVGEVKWLAGELGPARDWDVFLTELLAPVHAAMEAANGHGKPLAADLAQLAEAAEARRARAYARAREAVLSERYTQLQLRLGAWLEAKGWREQPVNEQSVRLFQPVHELADQLLHKRHRKARKTGRGFARLCVDDRHQLRIAMKKLRYAADFFRTLYDDKATKRYLQQLSTFQDALGRLNDVATATRLMHGLHDDGSKAAPGEPRAAGVVIGWHARSVAESESRLVDLWRSFADAKPFWSKPQPMV